MHLQRAITPTQSDAPVAIANNLNFLVASGFNVELNQHIFVVANAGCLDLVEYLSHQFGSPRGLTKRHNTLTLATAAANRLEPHSVLRVLLAHFENGLSQSLSQLVDGVEVNALTITRSQDPFCKRLKVLFAARIPLQFQIMLRH